MERIRREDGSATGDEAAEVHVELTRVLRGLSRETIRRGRLTSTRRGLSDTDIWLLMFVADRGRVRPSDMAAWQDVDKSTITMQVKRLIAGGYVESTADPRDRRATNVQITAEGAGALQEARERGRALLAGLTRGWAPAEVDELARALRRLADSVEQRLASPPRRG